MTATHTFHITYRNRQGTFMRILSAVTRRGLDLPYVRAEEVHGLHQATLHLEANPKQVAQMCREWSVTPDVLEVRGAVAGAQMAALPFPARAEEAAKVAAAQ